MIPINPETNPGRVAEILRICAMFPELVLGCTYLVTLHNWEQVAEELGWTIVQDGEPQPCECSVLHAFLYADVGLQDIQALCDIVTSEEKLDRILEDEVSGCLPIHVACRCASDDIIVYLAQKRPSLLQHIEGFDVGSPFQCALNNTRHPPSVDTLKLLLELFPGAVVTAFALCSRNGERKVPLEILQQMVDLYPNHYREIHQATEGQKGELCMDEKKLRLTMDLERTKIFCKLLPHLTRLFFNVDGWEADAFVYFLEEVARSQSTVEELGTSLPKLTQEEAAAIAATATCVGEENSAKKALVSESDIVVGEDGQEQGLSSLLIISPTEAFQRIMEGEHTLKCLTLQLRDKETESLHGWLDAIRLFGYTNPRHNQLNLNFLWKPGFSDHEVKLCAMNTITPGQDTRDFALQVASSTFDEPNFVKAVEHMIVMFNPSYLYLKAQVGRTDPKALQSECQQTIAAFFRRALTLPKPLVTLQVDFPFNDITTFFLELQRLDCCKLKHLNFLYAPVPDKAAVEACLDLVEHHNVTLEWCKPFADRGPRIQYYLDLNRLGRAVARSATTDRSTFLDLWLAARNDQKLNAADNNNNNNNNHGGDAGTDGIRVCRVQSILYGLLREAPSLWAEV